MWVAPPYGGKPPLNHELVSRISRPKAHFFQGEKEDSIGRNNSRPFHSPVRSPARKRAFVVPSLFPMFQPDCVLSDPLKIVFNSTLGAEGSTQQCQSSSLQRMSPAPKKQPQILLEASLKSPKNTLATRWTIVGLEVSHAEPSASLSFFRGTEADRLFFCEMHC